MTIDDPVDKFLQAENEAENLVEQLGKLRAETESYSSASSALDETTQNLGSLIERFTELGSQVASTVTTLRDIGTPELLARQDNLAKEVGELQTSLSQDVEAERAAHDAALAIIGELQTSLSQDVEGLRVALSSFKALVVALFLLTLIAIGVTAALSLAN